MKIRYRRIGGFDPPNDYVEVDGPSSTIVLLDGKRIPTTHYPMITCEAFVSREIWTREIVDDRPWNIPKS